MYIVYMNTVYFVILCIVERIDYPLKGGCLIMKHIPQDRYNVAWFTLAECVTRREKVRALGVYRLLSHSINDAALRYQLEGDILLAFEDGTALEKYDTAYRMYLKEGRLREAIAVCEHLHTIEPEKVEHLKKLVDLYKQIKMPHHEVARLKKLVDLYLQQENITNAEEVLTKLETHSTAPDVAHERYMFMIALLRNKKSSHELIGQHLYTTLDALIFAEDSTLLQKFLAMVEAMNGEVHAEALSYVKANNSTK